MNILVIGAGGVGASMASIAETRSFFTTFILADISLSRAEEAIALLDDRSKFVAEQIDARDRTAISALIHKVKADVVVNACDPRLNEPIFGAAYDSHCNYIDMAMNLSAPHPTNPYEEVGEPLGKSQLDDDAKWRERNILALVGMGVEPGLSDVFARYAADNLFVFGQRSKNVSIHQSCGKQSAVCTPPTALANPKCFTFPQASDHTSAST